MNDIKKEAEELIKQFYFVIFEINNGAYIKEDKNRYLAAQYCALKSIERTIGVLMELENKVDYGFSMECVKSEITHQRELLKEIESI